MDETELEAVQRICRDLGLPAGDSFTQDWAYELPEDFRTESYLYKYISAYANEEYGANEKRLLVQLALDIVNDVLQAQQEVGVGAWSALAKVLRTNSALHRDQVEYWASFDTPLEDCFALTPMVRVLYKELYA